MKKHLPLAAILLGLAPSLRAQDDAAFERVELRVHTAPAPGSVVVDHGSADGLAVGDAVRFRPRLGGVHEGAVIELDERSAVVELADRSVALEPGTRGEAFVPRERLEVVQEAPEPPPAAAEHPPWERAEEQWSTDLPLLAQIDAVRPQERSRTYSARLFMSGDQTWASLDDRSDSFFRLGEDVRIQNPFERGGELHLEMEQTYRQTDVPDNPEDGARDLRVDRFSYAWGNDRFSEYRWEAGRFLQNGMPEFGVLDGVEFGRRLENGDRVGASAGFMPEPDADMQTGDDFQIAAFYHWTADETERFSVDGGFQKSFHEGDADRDLLVASVDYLPVDSWNAHATAWVDYYTEDDVAKGSGFELTEVYATTWRRWKSGNGMALTYTHQRFPELLRTEFLPVEVDQLADDRNDRLSLSGWRWLTAERRAHGQIGVWDDEDESGGDAELGVDVRDLLLDRSRTDFTVFGAQGEFSSLLGVRASWGRYDRLGRWDVLYELGRHEIIGFDDDENDLVQHRVRASREMRLGSGWNVSGYVETILWDDDDAWSLGFYLQKSF